MQPSDIPRMRFLLRESYLAMLPSDANLQDEAMQKTIGFMMRGADGSADAIHMELANVSLEPATRWTWVVTMSKDEHAEHDLTKSVTGLELPAESTTSTNLPPLSTINQQDDIVTGMIGLVVPYADTTWTTTGELVRMAVCPHVRSKGLGAILMQKLLAKAKELKLACVQLTTANERAKEFYEKKCGFQVVETKSFMPGRNLFHLAYHLSVSQVSKLVLVGGTHGNERIGVSLCQSWRPSCIRDSAETRATAASVTRPSFETHIILANPKAVELNRRYVDQDLNRCITTTVSDGSHEASIAKSLYKQFGSKTSQNHSFLIDMHSTTSNVGVMIMINGGDAYGLRVAQHLHSLATTSPDSVSWTIEDAPASDKPILRLYQSPGTCVTAPSMDSLTGSGISIEIGPLAHGTLEHELVCITRDLVEAVADYIHSSNEFVKQLADKPQVFRDEFPIIGQGWLGKAPEKVTVYQRMPGGIDYPRSSVPTPQSSPLLDITSTIHPSFRGKDWAEVKPQQPVFLSISPVVSTSSANQAIETVHGQPYLATLFEPPAEAPSYHPGPQKPTAWYAVFINEQSYVEKGIAFALAKKESRIVL